MNLAHVGILLGGDDPYSAWYLEALAQAGLNAEAISDLSFDGLRRFDVILLCGRGQFDDPGILGRWLDEGRRCLVVSGDTWGLEKLLGVSVTSGRFSSAWLSPNGSPLWPEGADSALFYGGPKVHPNQAKTSVATDAGELAVSRNGNSWLVSPHVGQTMAYMQLGTSVEAHGVGPSDGSATWDEGPLRAEFGSRLGFDMRQDGLFLTPHADIVRELWIRTILEAISHTEKQSVLLWHLPGGATHAGLLSIDCDSGNPSTLYQLHSSLSLTGTRATFLSRGALFPPEVFAWLRQMGHEVGISCHESWRQEKVRLAVTNLGRIAGGQILTACTPDGVWQGHMQPYEAFALAGLHTVLAKGGMERGTAGCIFGTSHPFLARPTSVYEIPFHVNHMNMDDRVILPIKGRYGVIHSRVPLTMIEDGDGFAGVKRWVSLVKQSGGTFFTAEHLTNHARARRSAHLSQARDGSFNLESSYGMGTTTVLFSGRGLRAESGRLAPQVVQRYGREFTAITLEMGENRSCSFMVHSEDRRAA